MSVVSMDPRIRARRVEVMRLRGRRRLRLVVAIVVVAGLAIAAFALLRSPLFDVDTIAVEGAEHTDIDAVLAHAEPLVSQPLLEVETSTVREAIATLPWVDEVTTSTSIDGTLTVTLTEREAVAALVGPDGWLVVDRDGRVLDAVAELPAELVLVDGATWDATPGDWVSERALESIELASLLPASLAADVASVVDADGLQLVLFGSGVIEMGDATDLEAKFLAALTLLDQVSLTCLDRIDVRAPTVPVLTRIPDCS